MARCMRRPGTAGESSGSTATGDARLVWTADRPEVFAIAIDKAGVLYAASSPDGKIYRIENGKATEYFDPKTKYIWTLALAPDGALYAGTSDGGKVFRITGAGKGEEYYSTGQGNVTGLMIDAKGNVLAGTEPNGILYRITAKNKAFALYDASLPEIRAIAQTADGSVYAVGLGGALAKKVQAAQQSNQNTQTDTSGGAVTTAHRYSRLGRRSEAESAGTRETAAGRACFGDSLRDGYSDHELHGSCQCGQERHLSHQPR